MSNNSGSIRMLARMLVLVAFALVIGAAGRYADHASASAQTFLVTKEADTNDGSCDENDCSVREAFVAANAASPAGVASSTIIQIPAGTYKVEIAGVDEQESATGDFDVTGTVTVMGVGPDSTFLDGNSKDRLIDVRETGALRISDLTIQHGHADAGGTGGLRADGPLERRNVHIVSNVAEGTNDDGVTGGVTVRQKALIENSVISDNTATGNSTAGLFANDTSDVTIRHTLIERNSTTGDFPTGGAAFKGPASLDDVTVKDNTAHGKEPVAGLFAGNLSVVTIRNSQFLNNDTTGDIAAGGIVNRGQMTICDTTVDGNDTGKDGTGGILSVMNDDNTSKITLRRVTITNNTAGSGNVTGGVWVETPADLSEVTIDHNTVQDRGDGGMKTFDADPVTLNHVRITNNEAGTDTTGGLFVGGGSNVMVTDSWIDNNMERSCQRATTSTSGTLAASTNPRTSTTRTRCLATCPKTVDSARHRRSPGTARR